ncbi:hypothetical protein PR048_009883 [Dryococelus australis]|uniref:Uncharacterized protein n=1 Tax=Dryococelus australis TaxID=614101 RepID=A0ABQ9I129_9NEOP|nr:hypothetical protein PR048_009883 [Dryococelus australis]
MKERGKREIPEKTRQPTASSDMIPTCENPVTRPGIESGSPWCHFLKTRRVAEEKIFGMKSSHLTIHDILEPVERISVDFWFSSGASCQVGIMARRHPAPGVTGPYTAGASCNSHPDCQPTKGTLAVLNITIDARELRARASHSPSCRVCKARIAASSPLLAAVQYGGHSTRNTAATGNSSNGSTAMLAWHQSSRGLAAAPDPRTHRVRDPLYHFKFGRGLTMGLAKTEYPWLQDTLLRWQQYEDQHCGIQHWYGRSQRVGPLVCRTSCNDSWAGKIGSQRFLAPWRLRKFSLRIEFMDNFIVNNKRITTQFSRPLVAQSVDVPPNWGAGGYGFESRVRGAAVTGRLDCSPPTKANRVQSPAGNRAGRCRWSAGFLGELQFPPPLRSGAVPWSPHFTIIGSQHPVVS